MRGERGGVSANEYSCTQESKFGYLTPYLTYDGKWRNLPANMVLKVSLPPSTRLLGTLVVRVSDAMGTSSMVRPPHTWTMEFKKSVKKYRNALAKIF
jgi:hypothetical protein